MTVRVRRRIDYKDPRVAELARDADDGLTSLDARATALEAQLAALIANPVAGYTDEQAQDAVGTILGSTPTVQLAYDDATPEITAEVPDGALANVKLADMPAQTIKGNDSVAPGPPVDLTGAEATALLTPFTGDSGAGGVQGLVPAPAAGDAALGKVLHAGGGWAVPPNYPRLWAPPSAPHAMDWECEFNDLPSGWVWYDAAGVAATPIAAVSPYTAFNTGNPKFTRSRGAYIQCPANGVGYTLTQPYTVPTNAYFVAQIAGGHRGAAINNDSDILLALFADSGGKPTQADNYIYVGWELDAGRASMAFSKRVAGVSTNISLAADADTGIGSVWEYVVLQKVGTTFYAWAFTGSGQWFYLGTTTHAGTFSHVGFWFFNVTNSAPAPSIVRVGFFRTLDTAAGWPGI